MSMEDKEMTDELIGHLCKDMNCGNLPCGRCSAIRAVLEDYPKVKAEVERLTHLHNLDHSLADQWLARAEKAEAEVEHLKKCVEAERKIKHIGEQHTANYMAALEKAEAELAAARPLLEVGKYFLSFIPNDGKWYLLSGHVRRGDDSGIEVEDK
jgi:hypothetical protein